MAKPDINDETSTDLHQEPVSDTLRSLLDRYTAVWLWSIAFGTTVGVLYSLARISTGSRWGIAATFPMAIAGIGALFALTSLRYLLNYLRDYLLPEFFGTKGVPLDLWKDRNEMKDLANREVARKEHAAASLLVAFDRIFLALGCRIVAGLIEAGLRSLG